MPFRHSLLAALLLTGAASAVLPVTTSVAYGDSALAPLEIQPVPAYAPLAAVAVMLDTGQALLFDESAAKYRVVMVGDVVAGWKVVAIEARRVVVIFGEERDVLALVPPPRPMDGARATSPGGASGAKNGPAREIGPIVADADPAPAAPAPPAPKAKPAAPVEDPTAPRKLSRQELNRELGDFEGLGGAVDVTLAEGGGFKLARVEKSSWPYRMGLRAGDVIRSVGGERVASIDDAARVYARLRSMKHFTIEIDRPMAGIVDVGDPPTTRVVLQYHVR